MIDTHCHLTHARFSDDRDEVIERARDRLSACVTIGTGVADARRCLELTIAAAGFVHCTAGIDPFTSHRAGDGFDDELAALADLLGGGGFCALGEIGLDYHYDLDPRAVQAERFERQLELAVELDLPVVIHVREAHDDMARVLSRHPRNRGVIHSFTAGPAEAGRYLELGFSLAFNGVLTFKKAEEIREAARLVPADRILVETDSPYLAPVPFRGRRCEPAWVAHTIDRLAEARNEDPTELTATTVENAMRLFELQPPGKAVFGTRGGAR